MENTNFATYNQDKNTLEEVSDIWLSNTTAKRPLNEWKYRG